MTIQRKNYYSKAQSFGIIWPSAAGLIINGLIFALGWNDSDSAVSPLLPPGWVIGAVWMALLLLMGMALAGVKRAGELAATRWVILLILSCLAYPFYAIMTDNQTYGYIGSVVTFGLSIVAIVAARPSSPRAAWLLLPTPAWVLYATVAMLLAGA